ncbi:hypothetical protein CVT25_014998 [Psilocybe cyanescens]|uniref:Uncharacterized protein n=1 Tax=Psilocybe cyanescens TaxID=93625 RepID=A0A409XIB2_PSICY|nr:hypothetical protein CVT25_014998 [Psilocybe cyanescens]
MKGVKRVIYGYGLTPTAGLIITGPKIAEIRHCCKFDNEAGLSRNTENRCLSSLSHEDKDKAWAQRGKSMKKGGGHDGAEQDHLWQVAGWSISITPDLTRDKLYNAAFPSLSTFPTTSSRRNPFILVH